MPLTKEHSYTIDDIYALPDGERAELIDGQMYMMAPPSTRHQAISGELFTEINNHIRSKKGPCRVYAAPFAIFLNKDSKTYVEPDISVICDKDKVDNRGCNGAPDFIIEISSPSNSGYDYLTKLNLYQAAGVREYWIVNPIKKTVHVYFFEDDIWADQHSFTDKVKVNIYDDLYIDFSELNI